MQKPFHYFWCQEANPCKVCLFVLFTDLLSSFLMAVIMSKVLCWLMFPIYQLAISTHNKSCNECGVKTIPTMLPTLKCWFSILSDRKCQKEAFRSAKGSESNTKSAGDRIFIVVIALWKQRFLVKTFRALTSDTWKSKWKSYQMYWPLWGLSG